MGLGGHAGRFVGALVADSRPNRVEPTRREPGEFHSERWRAFRPRIHTSDQQGEVVLKLVRAPEVRHRIQYALLDIAHRPMPMGLHGRKQPFLTEFHVGCVRSFRQSVGIQDQHIPISDGNLTLLVRALRKQAKHWPAGIEPVALKRPVRTAPYQQRREVTCVYVTHQPLIRTVVGPEEARATARSPSPDRR